MYSSSLKTEQNGPTNNFNINSDVVVCAAGSCAVVNVCQVATTGDAVAAYFRRCFVFLLSSVLLILQSNTKAKTLSGHRAQMLDRSGRCYVHSVCQGLLKSLHTTINPT